MEMNPIGLFVILMATIPPAVFLIVFLGIVLPVKRNRRKYYNFNKQNSLAVRELEEVNKKYGFKGIPTFSYKHTYDNPTHYNEISCIDYLIYQLATHDLKTVKKIIEDLGYNRLIYNDYLNEKNKIKCFSRWENLISSPNNMKRLSKYEHRVFDDLVKKPIVKMGIKITLTRTDINGRVITRKSATATEEDIRKVIPRIENKQGSRYLDEDIWTSIVRVERGKVSNKMRFFIYKRDGYRCQICHRRFNPNNLEIDHIYPIAKGGKTTMDNLQTLCHRCNVAKGDKVL